MKAQKKLVAKLKRRQAAPNVEGKGRKRPGSMKKKGK